jgi:VanZ family protein
MLALRYRRLWVTASILLVAIVVWGSLQTLFTATPVHGFDKVEHFGTYLFLAVWFTGLFGRPRYWAVAGGLLALGLAMETAQWLMQAGRVGDPYDVAANTAGIGAGLLLALLATGGWAQKVESLLASGA